MEFPIHQRKQNLEKWDIAMVTLTVYWSSQCNDDEFLLVKCVNKTSTKWSSSSWDFWIALPAIWLLIFYVSINLGQCCIIIITAIFQDCPHDVMPNWAEVISCMISNSTSDLRPDLIFLDIHFFHSPPTTFFILELHKSFSVLVKTWRGGRLYLVET